ncbi:ATP-dependent translocase ABCB1-like isoform X2 [Daphnia pulicaria]|nr:ATP-dependent translocase ABCB1-like isoform X2 [Daphnia pulicaria]
MAPNLDREEVKGQINEAFSQDEDELKKKEEDTSSSSIPSISDDGNGKKKKKKKDKEKPPPPEIPPVPFFDLFRYASPTDFVLLCFGTLGAVGTGVCFPLMLILFGDITNAFVGGGMDQETINEINCNISTDPNYTYPYPLGPTCNLTDPSEYANSPQGQAIQDEFTKFGIYVAIIGAVLLLLGFIFVTALNFTAENQVYRIRSKFLQAVLRQDVGWYDTKSSNDFASRITEDLNKIQDGVGEKIGMFIFSMTCFIASIINAFIHGWELTLVMLVSTPVLAVSMGVLAKVQASLTENELKAYAKAGGIAEEVFSSIRTVMAFGGQRKEIDRFQDDLAYAKKAGIKRGMATGIGAGLVWGIIYASYSLAFWYGITLILAACDGNSYSSSDLLIVFFSVLIGAMQIGQAAPYMEAFSVARGAAATIFSIIDRVPPIDSSSNEGLVPDGVDGKISFRDVFFNYPSRPDVKILQGISFDVTPGQTVALVGTSGCGKSTCIQLLQRFYDPLEGSVTIDGNELRNLNLGWLRDQMGMVGQEPVLFGTSIGENICYGRDGVSKEEMERAAKEANAHDFIQRLPRKYDTLVGERGGQLSGGQKQRIAIARALVRQPKILLLDEATSALDTQSEAVVQKALDKARQGRTTIIVAHRLTTIRNADRIIVMKDGIVQEDGTHDKLMALNGIYYQLVIAQQGGESDSKSSIDDESDFEDEEEKIEKAKSWIPDEKDEMMDAVSLAGSHPLGRHNSVRSARLSVASSAVSAQSEDIDVSLMDIMRMNRKEWHFIVVGVIGSAIVGLSTPVFAILFSEVLGVLTPGGSLEEQEEKRAQGNFYALMFLILGIVVGFSAFAQSFSFSIAGESLTSRLRGLTFQAILKQEIGWFDRKTNSVGALCARLSGDAASVQGATGSRIGVLFQALTTMIASTVLALYFQWKLGLVALCFVPLLLVSTYFQAKIIMGQSALEREALQKSAKVAMEAISNIRTVASLGKERQFHTIYMESLRGPHKEALKKSWIRGFIFGFASSIPMFAYAVTMYYGGWLVVNECLDFTSVFKVSESLLFGTQMIGQAVAFAPNYNKAKVAANRIFALLRRVPQIDASSNNGLVLQNVDGNVNFEQVRFRYPTRKDAEVLQGLSLAVRAGQTVALVGHSGCGKSTCIQLLERFYDPDSGQVQLDGQDINPVNISSLRSQMGIVSQEPILFNLTIAQNIAYGDNSRVVPMDEIIEAARKANIHVFIQSLPSGYETMVGERGTQLSGGQKQRVAIARALIRNPKILLLDEATSALDSESEHVVQMALDAAREGRTCITIAHRLSTIQNADNIIVINHGTISEQGTHEELIKLGGLYFELCSVQGIALKPVSSSANLEDAHL